VIRRALITGITGQDGSYLAELLLSKGYRVFGLVRRSSSDFQKHRIAHILDRVDLLPGDLADQSSLERAVKIASPNEVYNLAAQSFVHTSWAQPEATSDITGLGVLRLLEAVRLHAPEARFYQASSSEMFGAAQNTPQNENTPFYPRSPYGVAKAFAHHIAINYRESYGLFVSCGILFNHESPRRGKEFVTRKITDGVARIKLGREKSLLLGDLSARRDWGFAGDYVMAMWQMLQQDSAENYIIATGHSHSVQDFLEVAFEYAGLRWQEYVKRDVSLIRPAEVYSLIGDASKAKSTLGWTSKKSFEQMIHEMVDADCYRLIHG
jgi:GDPmannose 4,6-dehydratase